MPFFRIIHVFFISIFLLSSSIAQEIFISEDFESGLMPTGWTQEKISGNLLWNIRTGAGTDAVGNQLTPDTAAVGTYNMVFQKQGNEQEVTRIITPAIDLDLAIIPELTFWYALEPFQGTDYLKIYVKQGEEGQWQQLASYETPTYEWQQSSVIIPAGSPQTYIAFEGTNNWGMGACVDEIKLEETVVQELYLDSVSTIQASSDRIAAGTQNNPILRTQLRIKGNTGEFIFDEYTANSLNTDDSDIENQGVKLYYTSNSIFNTSHLVAQGNFVNGSVQFTDLDLNLPAGYAYLWLVYDVKEDAGNLNVADASIPAGAFGLSSGVQYPSIDHDPPGNRKIYRTLLFDDFDTDKGWVLTGEFERAAPSGLGGSTSGGNGPAGASHPYRGTKILGTDVTGMGEYPGNYENNLTEREYQAISPSMDCSYFTEVNLSFYQWLNVYFSGTLDKATIDVSTNDGQTWQEVWRNDGANLFAIQWTEQEISLSEFAARKDSVKIRFTLGPTMGSQNYSGWNIDNLMISGNYLTKDMAVSEWLFPLGGCGMTSEEEVGVRVKNLAAEPTPPNTVIKYSLDGGISWYEDVITQSIAVDDSIVHVFSQKADFSEPGRYNNVIAKVVLPGDQDPENDAVFTSVFSVPVVERPYHADFAQDDGLWDADGINSSWVWGNPSGSVIDTAFAGEYTWITNHNGPYHVSEYSWVTSPCFDFSGTDYSVLDFHLQYDTPEEADGVAIQYSLNEGASWQMLETYNDTLVWNWYSHDNIASLNSAFGNGLGWSGQNDDWERFWLVLPPELSDYDGVKFRFVFAGNDESENYEGAAFDDFKIYRAPADVGVSALIDPVDDCILSEEQTITVEIQNFGINKILAGTSVPVALQVDTLEMVIENFIPGNDILPGESAQFTFSHTFNLSSPGTYQVLAFTMLEEDTNFYADPAQGTNDSLSVNIEVFGFPEPDLGDDIYTLQPDTLILDAGNGFEEYLWQDESTEQTFEVQDSYTAVYSATVTDQNQCSATDSVMVFTHDLVVEGLLSPQSDCELPETSFVEFILKNRGEGTMEAGVEIPVFLYFEGEFVDAETIVLESDMASQDSVIYQFDSVINLSDPEDGFDVFIEHGHLDGNTSNNSHLFEITEYGFPSISLGDTIYSTQPDTLVLSPGDDFDAWLWQDGSSESSFEVSSSFNQMYSVMVTDEHGCPASDSVQVITYDLSISEFIGPASSCEFIENEMVKIKLTNEGLDTIPENTTVRFSFGLDENTMETDTVVLQNTIPPAKSYVHTFETRLDLTTGSEFEIWATHDFTDGVLSNDSLIVLLEEFGYPEVSLGDDIYTTEPDTLLLDAGPGFETYFWQDSSEGQFYTVDSEQTQEYIILVTDENNCEAEDAVTVYTHDIEISEIVSPFTSCELSPEELITFEITNTGLDSFSHMDSIPVELQLNGMLVVTDTLFFEEDMEPGEGVIHTFDVPLDLQQLGIYHIMVRHRAKDGVTHNDQLLSNIEVLGYPVLDLPHFVSTTEPDTVILDAGEGFDDYLWSDGSDEQLLEVEDYGIYTVTVYNEAGCETQGSIHVVEELTDMAVTRLISPDTICAETKEVAVKMEISNVGNMTIAEQSQILLTYQYNEQETISQVFTLEQSFLPGSTLTCEFDTVIPNIGGQSWEMKAWMENADDEYADNDSLFVGRPVHQLPRPLLQDDIFTLQPDTVVLDAGEGYSYYLWQNGSQNRYFPVSSPHTSKYNVTVVDDNLCIGKGNIWVNTFDLDMESWSLPVSVCGNTHYQDFIEVKMVNRGVDAFDQGTSVPVEVFRDNELFRNAEFTLQETLLPGDTVSFNLSMPVSADQPGSYDYAIKNGLKDADAMNDSLISTIHFYDQPTMDLGEDILTSMPDTISLHAGEGFQSYLWHDGHTDSSYPVTGFGLHWVLATDQNGCQASDSVWVEMNTSVDKFSDDSNLRLYPNPVKTTLNLFIDKPDQRKVIFRITDSQGRLFQSLEFENITDQFTFDVSDLYPGLYFLQIQQTGSQKVIKFIKN